jgi:general stress protein YciG
LKDFEKFLRKSWARGGHTRAKRLSKERRQEIAAMGGKASKGKKKTRKKKKTKKK